MSELLDGCVYGAVTIKGVYLEPGAVHGAGGPASAEMSRQGNNHGGR